MQNQASSGSACPDSVERDRGALDRIVPASQFRRQARKGSYEDPFIGSLVILSSEAKVFALVVEHERLDSGAFGNQAQQPRFASAGVGLDKKPGVDQGREIEFHSPAADHLSDDHRLLRRDRPSEAAPEFTAAPDAVYMLLVGASGELPANPRRAALLAHRLLEFKVSAVVALTF
jgi:hypothetical protein